MGRPFAQSAAFVLALFVLFFEYVRPQATYPIINVLPFARISLIGAVVACALAGRSSFDRQLGWGLVAGFTAVIFLSILTAVYPEVGFASVDLWLSWLMTMYVVSSAAENEEQLILLIGSFLLWNLRMSFGGFRRWAAIGFQFRDWGLNGPSGWFQNSGEFGIEMAVFFPMVIYFLIALYPHLVKWKRYVLLFAAVTAVFSMVGSSSRGAVLGGAAVGLWFLWRSPNRTKGFLAISALSVITWFILPEAQKARFASAGDDNTSISRLTYWKDGIEIANQHPIFGIGYNNWMPYYTTRYNPDGQLPHNIFVEAASQLGYVGLAVFVALIAYTFWENAQTRKIASKDGRNPNRFMYYMAFGLDGALIGYLTSGFFVTVLFYPYFWVNLAFTIALAKVVRKSANGRTPARRYPIHRQGRSRLIPVAREPVLSPTVSPPAAIS